MKKLLILTMALALVVGAMTIYAQDDSEGGAVDTVDKAMDQSIDQVVVYYLHMNRRCATCEKLEAYSKEAVETGFAEQLKDSSVAFKVENFETEGNEHFAKDYQLFSQSLILSRQHDGKETEWKNLDKIWELVGDKEKFTAYVQSEVADFVNPKEAK